MDRASFDELFYRQRGQLHSYALGLVRDHHLAEDLVQEAALKLWKAIEAGRITIEEGERRDARFLSLMRNNIYFLFLESRRRRTLEVLSIDELEERAGAEVPDRGESFVDMILYNKLIDQCLTLLSEEDRRIMQLLVEGFSSREIARELGDISPASVKKRIERARGRLRSLLGPVIKKR